MNDLLTKWFGSSWRSTLAGMLLGLPPVIVGASQSAGVTLGHGWLFALAMSSGLGALILGFNAKDKQVHSTAAQVDDATTKAAK